MKTKILSPLLIIMMILIVGTPRAFSQNTIRVQDGKIFSSCDEEIVMRGVNEMFIWSQDRTGVNILPEIAQTGSNAVRLVWTTEGAEAEFDALINNSIKNNMIPVAELHDATGDFSKLQLLLDYWKRPAVLSTIQKYKKWLIVNIGNEVGNGSESTAQWVAFYKDAITQLRDAGVDTPLMIDCGGYGNRESYFLEGGNELLEFDPLHNIIFAVHTYWTNGDDQAKVDRLNTMIADAKLKKLPYIIGEGPQKVASPIACGQSFPYKEMMSRLEEEKIGWLSWSWGAVDNNDCGSPNSELDITTDGKFGNWGTVFAEEMCITDINSIKNTSIIPESMIDPSIASCGVTYSIMASAGEGGTISPSGNVIISEGENQIFDITVNRGFKIDAVLVDGISVGAVDTYTFSTVTENHTIVVNYATVPLPPQVPYVNGQPQPIPGKIKATSFDLGGEVVAYHDTTIGNDGDGIRPEEDVDTETAGDGGNIGFTADGEWMEYTVDIVQAGTYTIEVLVASENSLGAYHIEFEGIDATGIQNVSSTGSWTSFVPQKISNVTLAAGEQVMRMYIDRGGFNFSTMTFTSEGTPGNNAPTASFTATPESGISPLEVQFDASGSSDPEGDILTYNWDFGNGQTSTEVAPTITFTDIKTYTVSLTVNDGTNTSASVTKEIVVSDGSPLASFTVSAGSGGVPLEVTFDGSASTDPTGGNLTYSWDLGNGEMATTAITTTTYTEVGQFLATLTVTNATGDTNIQTKTITVTDGSVSCAFGTPVANALPSINATFQNIFVIGNGGPNLDNVTSFEINWDLTNNGLYQLSMSTTDGNPGYYVNFLSKVTQNFNSSEPEVTITGSGFSGLDGAYWVNIDNNNNFVLVSKTGGFTIYFSTMAIAPDCDGGSNPTPMVDGGVVTGGPFEFIVGDGVVDTISGISLSGAQGTNNTWVVTDDQLNILDLPPTLTALENMNFDGTGTGTCLIWHLSYEDGLLGASVGSNTGNLQGTFDLSNAISVIRTPVGTGVNDCTFGTPLADALPSIDSKFENIFVIGNGGPNLDNVTSFEINWNLFNKGLYVISMSTNNGAPDWYNNFLTKVTHTFGTAQPSVTITDSGFVGLDGDYWVTIHTGSFVLVSKTGGFTIYCSTSSVKPDCQEPIATRERPQSDVVVAPNPASDFIEVSIKNNLRNTNSSNVRVTIFDLVGQVVKVKNTENRKGQQEWNVRLPIEELETGMYILETFDFLTKERTINKILVE